MRNRIETRVYRVISVIVSLVLIAGVLPTSVYFATSGNNVPVVVNGDFENGTVGFKNINAAVFEVIAEDGNASNHVLHLKGAGKYKQTVSVRKNTDYIWTLRMKKLDDQQSVYFDAIAEDGTTNLITAVSGASAGTYANLYNGRAAVDINKGLWGIFRIKFNSGNNTSVALTGDTWAANREYYTDDWQLEELPEPGELTNGDFEDGVKGFKNINAALFEVIAEEGNISNHVLHLKGAGKFQQTVSVDKNTDYIWTLRMKKLDDQQSVYFDVIAEDLNTNLVTSVSSSSSGAYTNMYNGRAAVNISKDSWGTFVIKFNSGNNRSVSLTGDAWAENREYYTDDWTLTEEIKTGVIVNGGFDNGLKGYTDTNTGKFEVIAEPGNTENNVLHLIGGGSYYQKVPVVKNTDYVWTFRMKDIGNTDATGIGVCAENGTDNLISEILQGGGGYAALNDGAYSSVATYNKAWVTFTVKFNSGDNESVKLMHDLRSENREIYMDDWKLAIEPKGDIINGDFESGTLGYTNIDTAKFEVIPEPGNTSNHILHLVGGGSYYQRVRVTQNTDYIWTFRMKDIGNIGSTRIYVCSENGTDNLITEISHSGGGYTSLNDGTYSSVATYNKAWVTFTVKFNSGDNQSIRLLHNTWTTNREIYMDDWTFSRPRKKGEILNGDFNEGTKYYDNRDAVTFEAVTDPQDGKNTVLHAGGGGKFSQTIIVAPNTDYVWSFKMRSLDSAGNIYADVVQSDSTFITGLVSHIGGTYAQMYNGRAAVNAGGNWGTFSVRFNSGANTELKLQIDTWASGRDRYFDDWKIKVAAPTGELLNGDFESDDLSAYDCDQYISYAYSEDAHGGNGAVLIGKNEKDGSGLFYQSISVEKNTDYIWRFWVKFNNINSPVGASVRKTGGAFLASKIGGDCDTVIEPAPGFDFHRIRYGDSEWHEYKLYFSTGDNQVTDLLLFLYKAEAELITDDWSLEKVGKTSDSNTLIDVGFEQENMGCHEITKPCWKVTDEDAHSGKYSIKYDGSASSGPTDLLYLNENGVIADTVTLEANTKYRFSFWYKGVGDRLDMANVTFRLYSGGATYHCKEIYTNANTEWKYAEHIFDSKDKNGFRLLLNGMILGTRKFYVYVDDIKLEKISVGVNDDSISPADVNCTDDLNLIPSGTQKTINGKFEKLQKLTLSPYGVYKFKVSYTAVGANGKIGIAVDENGTPLDGKSIIDVTDTNGQSNEKAFVFTAPENGTVYLVTSNTAGTVTINDLVLYAANPTPETPVDKVEFKSTAKAENISIWDQDFDFDFDWNNGVEDDEPDNIEIDESKEQEPEHTAPTGQRYQRIKRRRLISKGSSGLSAWMIVLICVGSAVIVAAAAIFTVIIIRRKKEKLKLKGKSQ